MSQRDPQCISYSTLIGSLGLMLLSALTGHAQTPAKPSQRILRVEIEAGAKRQEKISFDNSCAAAINVRMRLGGNKFIQMEGPGSVRLKPQGNEIIVRIDATKLPSGEYSDLLTFECLDCQKHPGCSQHNFGLLIVLTVTLKPRARTGADIPAAQITAAINATLAALAEEFERRVRRLEELKGRTEDGKLVNGYDADEVRDLLAWAKSQLMAAFQREGLYAMRDYVAETFKPPPPVRVRADAANARLRLPSRGVFSTAALSFRAGAGPTRQGFIATAESAAAAFEYVRDFFTVARSNTAPITLKVRSEPELANVVLETRNRQQRYEISTNEDRRGFWPGRYRLTVTKAGFVNIEQGEQNFGSWNDTIDCTLVRTGAANFCRIK